MGPAVGRTALATEGPAERIADRVRGGGELEEGAARVASLVVGEDGLGIERVGTELAATPERAVEVAKRPTIKRQIIL